MAESPDSHDTPQHLNDDYREIEDIIDVRKRLGQYNIHKYPNNSNIRCVYSSFQRPDNDRTVTFDETSLLSGDKDLSLDQVTPEMSGTKHTDSEITIVRVRCDGGSFKRKLNKWDHMNDIAIPGDGTHLGESPSMVNLATLVSQNMQCDGDDEYLVPISSWDPAVKCADDCPLNLKCCSDSMITENSKLRVSFTDPNIPHRIGSEYSRSLMDEDFESFSQYRSNFWTGKFQKTCRKSICKACPTYDTPTAPSTAEDRQESENNKLIENDTLEEE